MIWNENMKVAVNIEILTMLGITFRQANIGVQ